MTGKNRWLRATMEATGEACEVVAVYELGPDGKALGDPRLVLGDGQALRRIATGRFQTRKGMIVVSAGPESP